METLDEVIETLVPREEKQRRAMRIAAARRKLERLREEQALHQCLAQVWDEPAAMSGKGV